MTEARHWNIILLSSQAGTQMTKEMWRLLIGWRAYIMNYTELARGSSQEQTLILTVVNFQVLSPQSQFVT
jgi:hypothetical protein